MDQRSYNLIQPVDDSRWARSHSAMLKERWPLITFFVVIAVTAPFWHELLPDEHFEEPVPAVEGHSPQYIDVFSREKLSSVEKSRQNAPWKIYAGPLAFEMTSWVGLQSRDVGCRIEKAFETNVDFYGCDDDVAKTGDACIEKTVFYSGPKFPKVQVGAVHGAISDILLDWEGAKLREVTLRLHSFLSLDDAKRLVLLDGPFLPAAKDDAETVADVDNDESKGEEKKDGFPRAKFEKCGDQVCINLTAFAHVTNVKCK